MNVRAFEVGPFGVNTYVLWDDQTKQAAVVDPTMGSEGVYEFIKTEGLKLAYVINTHGHFDHVTNDAYFRAIVNSDGSSPQLLIHKGDLPLLQDVVSSAVRFGVRVEKQPDPDRLIEDGDVIAIGNESLTVLHTPGHSQGGVCLHCGSDVLVGDTLFFGSIGRTDFPGASHPQLINSVRTKLFVLPDDTKVHPGHGPATTIGFEKQYNPFFQEDSQSGLWVP